MGGRGEVLDAAVLYARILFGGAAITFVGSMLDGVMRGAGNVRVPAICSAVSLGLQLAVTPLCMFGAGLGLAGALDWTLQRRCGGAGRRRALLPDRWPVVPVLGSGHGDVVRVSGSRPGDAAARVGGRPRDDRARRVGPLHELARACRAGGVRGDRTRERVLVVRHGLALPVDTRGGSPGRCRGRCLPPPSVCRRRTCRLSFAIVP